MGKFHHRDKGAKANAEFKSHKDSTDVPPWIEVPPDGEYFTGVPEHADKSKGMAAAAKSGFRKDPNDKSRFTPFMQSSTLASGTVGGTEANISTTPYTKTNTNYVTPAGARMGLGDFEPRAKSDFMNTPASYTDHTKTHKEFFEAMVVGEAYHANFGKETALLECFERSFSHVRCKVLVFGVEVATVEAQRFGDRWQSSEVR